MVLSFLHLCNFAKGTKYRYLFIYLISTSTKPENIKIVETKQVVNSCNGVTFGDHGVGNETIFPL